MACAVPRWSTEQIAYKSLSVTGPRTAGRRAIHKSCETQVCLDKQTNRSLPLSIVSNTCSRAKQPRTVAVVQHGSEIGRTSPSTTPRRVIWGLSDGGALQ